MKNKLLILLTGFITMMTPMAMADSKTCDTDTRSKNIQSVQRFYSLLEQENIPAFLDLFAENGKQVNPYHSGLIPAEVAGKANLTAFWTPVPNNFDGMRFYIDEIMPFESPDKIAVKLKGEIKLKNGAGFYKNDYFCLFYFDNSGKITEYIEYFNPIEVAKGFGLMDKIK